MISTTARTSWWMAMAPTSDTVVVTATSGMPRIACPSRRHSPGSSCRAMTAVTRTAAMKSVTNMAA
jgi:hypothetical protein